MVETADTRDVVILWKVCILARMFLADEDEPLSQTVMCPFLTLYQLYLIFQQATKLRKHIEGPAALSKPYLTRSTSTTLQLSALSSPTLHSVLEGCGGIAFLADFASFETHVRYP